MKLDFWTVILIAVIFCAGGYMFMQNRAQKREVARVAQETAMKEAAKAKEESERKTSAKKMLQDYIAREETNLKKSIEQNELWLKAVKDDQKTLSDAVSAIEKRAKEADAASRARKRKRYSSAERVLLILNDKTINALAVKYLEEDFSAMRAKYQDGVNKEIKLHGDYQKKLKAISEKYHKTVAGINEHVDKLNKDANEAARYAYTSVKNSLEALKQERAKKDRDLKSLRHGVSTRKQIHVLAGEIDSLDRQIFAAQERFELAVYTDKESKARSAESLARKKQVKALEVRDDESKALTADRIHETAVFNLATLYENRSLDMIRDKMKNRTDILQKAINDAQDKLRFLGTTSANMDFLSAKDFDKIREKISKQLIDGVSF